MLIYPADDLLAFPKVIHPATKIIYNNTMLTHNPHTNNNTHYIIHHIRVRAHARIYNHIEYTHVISWFIQHSHTCSCTYMLKYISCLNTYHGQTSIHKACHHHHPHPEQQLHHLGRLTPAKPSTYIQQTVIIDKVKTGPKILVIIQTGKLVSYYPRECSLKHQNLYNLYIYHIISQIKYQSCYMPCSWGNTGKVHR